MKKNYFVILFLVLSLFIIPFSIKARIYDFGTVTLRNGSRGEAVKELQRFLNTNLNLGLVIDGKLGQKTIAILKKWQKDNRLKDDGLVGKKTKDMMNYIMVKPSPLPLISPSTSTSTTTIPTPISISTHSCNQKDFTMALIFVIDTSRVNATDIARYKDQLSYIINRFPLAFSSATSGLATMTIPSDPVIFDSAGLITNGNLNVNATIKKFYQTNSDSFDFISLFVNDPTGSWHSIVQNNIKNIGTSVVNMSNNYGSNGRLIGINYMGNVIDNPNNIISCYQNEKNDIGPITIDNQCGMGILLHETEHQWASFTGDIVQGSNASAVSLGLRDENSGGVHYYHGLTSPTNTVDPLYPISWQKSQDGMAFLNVTSGSDLYKFHPFTLYYMGLLPQNQYDTKFNILQTDSTYTQGEKVYDSMQFYKQVSVNDIIAKEGLRSCQ